MKISCEIIKDLLPLYHDGVCSDESKRFVNKHLSECTGCSKELELMGGMLSVSKQEDNLQEAMPVKNLSRKWRRGMLKSLLKGIAITIITIAAIALFLSIFVGFRIAT